MTGLPRSSGRIACSQDAKKASASICMIARGQEERDMNWLSMGTPLGTGEDQRWKGCCCGYHDVPRKAVMRSHEGKGKALISCNSREEGHTEPQRRKG